MTKFDKLQIKKLIDWITDHADYGDIDELCNELDVDVDWFDQFYDWEVED